MPIVKKNYGPRVQPASCCPDDRLSFVFPVKTSHGPHHHPELSLPENWHQAEPPRAIRRSEKRRTHTCDPLNGFLRAANFRGHKLAAAWAEEGMRIRMVANGMTFTHNAPGNFRVTLDVLAAKEKGCGNLMLGQDVKNPFRKRRSGAVVKGKHDATACFRTSHQRGPDHLR